jgi:hypothetical protein
MTRYVTGLQPCLGLDLLPGDGLATLGKRTAGFERIREVFQQLMERFCGHALDFGGNLSRDDSRQPLPVLSQINNLTAGSVVRGGADVLTRRILWPRGWPG